MVPRRTFVLALVALLPGAAACAPREVPPVPPPARPVEDPTAEPPAPLLPPIPRVRGALELRVSYPREDAPITTRGDNFIFGSTGSGDARVWIDGQEVEVQPNGGFLAFLPVPPDGVYRLRATLGEETQELERSVRPPPPPPQPADTPVIVPTSVYPAGGWVALPDERIEVGFRGSARGTAWLVLPDGERIPLLPDRGPEGRGTTDFEVAPRAGAGIAHDTPPDLVWYRGYFLARRLVASDTAVAWPALTGEPRDVATDATLAEGTDDARVELYVNGQTVTRSLGLNLLLAPPDRPRVGIAWDPDPPEQNGNERHIGRPGPGSGPFHYVWRNGTELELTGERDGNLRVRLTDDLTAWSPANKITMTAPGTPPPTSRVAAVRMDPQPGWIDVRVALTRRLPYAVEEGDRSLSLLVFGAISRASFMQHGRVDPYIERGEWSQPADRVFRLDVHLAGLPWGYETFWSEGGDLILRIRRPPVIDPDAPLRGITIAVDPGHGGADRFTMGPTGVTEADANLWIALPLADLLERQGARVVMTRTTDETVSLVQRTNLAEHEDVDLFVSVHNNAFPDGVNPWENNGTSVYYTHPRAAGLAWALQEELLAELGLRDIGVGRADLHVTRFTWAPSILTETMFMMVPEQEAALADRGVQQRIAEAHARGIARWLRDAAPRP